jgi:hypothetical protein
VRPRLKRPKKNTENVWRSVPAWGRLPIPNHAAPHPSGGGRYGHSLSGTCWYHPPTLEVGIWLVWKSLSCMPRVHDLRYGVGLLLTSLFSSSLVASLYPMASLDGKHYRHIIQRIPLGLSLKSPCGFNNVPCSHVYTK